MFPLNSPRFYFHKFGGSRARGAVCGWRGSKDRTAPKYERSSITDWITRPIPNPPTREPWAPFVTASPRAYREPYTCRLSKSADASVNTESVGFQADRPDSLADQTIRSHLVSALCPPPSLHPPLARKMLLTRFPVFTRRRSDARFHAVYAGLFASAKIKRTRGEGGGGRRS